MRTQVISPAVAEQLARTSSRLPIIVGTDASPGSVAAVAWAAAEAAARRVPLRIIHTWTWQMLEPWSSAIDRRAIADLERTGHALVDDALETARRYPDLDASTEVVEGYAPDALTPKADEIGLVVLGSHRQRSSDRVSLGSVANTVAARSPVPVVVAWGVPDHAPGQGTVVVGVAGEPEDERVLAFAFEHASRHRMPLRAVHCWQPAPLADHRLPPPDVARLWLAESVVGWQEEYPDVDVHTEVIRAKPVDGLVNGSGVEDLLVVGRHGARIRFGTLLGSTSIGTLHHAGCPVAVIPPPRKPF